MRSIWLRVFTLLFVPVMASVALGQCTIPPCVNIDKQVQGSRWPAFGTDSGSANTYVVATIASMGPGLRTGSKIIFFAANANTTTSTLDVDSTGVKTIKKWSSGSIVNLSSGDISAGQLVEVVYDGTYYQVVGGMGGGGGSGTVTSIATTSPISGGTITTTGTISCPTCVTSAASLTSNQLMTGAGSQASQTLGSLGTTTTVLHGNASGAPTFGAVSLTADISGTLAVGNGGTATTAAPIKRFLIAFGACNAGASLPAWNLPSSSAMGSVCSTDNQEGNMTAADGQLAYMDLILPSDFSSFNQALLNFTTTDTTNGHTVIFALSSYCVQPNNNVANPNGPTYNSATSVTTTLGASAVSGGVYQVTFSSLTMTGCSAGYKMRLKLTRSTDTDTDTAVQLTDGLLFAYNGTYQ